MKIMLVRSPRKFCTSVYILLLVLFTVCSIVNAKSRSIKVNAKEAILIEAETRKILVAQNCHERIQPASFTKIVTLYLVFDAIENGQIELTDKIPISKKAWRTGGSKMFVKVGTRVPLEDLIKGIAIVSGNDACVAVAEYLQGSVENFVDKMNEVVSELGLKDTHFTTPNGLPSKEQYTTAYDMAMLAAKYIERFPQALKYHSMQEFTYQGITQKNRNGLLRKAPDLVDGLKTGYVANAGYHLIATAKKKNMRLIAVVMGAPKPYIREKEALKLLYYGFGNFTKVNLLDKGKPVVEVKVWKGKVDKVGLVAQSSGHIVVPSSEKSKLRLEIDAPKSLFAPLKKGEVKGIAKIISGTKPIKEIKLEVEKDVPKAGILKRLYHSVALMAVNINISRISLVAASSLILILILYLIVKRRRRRKRRFY
ncbi:MAG TPA: D-alanyl-D-alanine carboxypeptidase [Deltaproteobacteria bacterium]|nr:D-alanyl-D-alanine carboxypeptidase [Deltaproteobacteria bacterium]